MTGEQPAEHLARLKVQFPLWQIRHVREAFGFEATRLGCREWSQTLADLELKLRAADRSGRFALLPGDRVELTAIDEDYLRYALTVGDRGTVEVIDSLGTVHVRWDSGTRAGIIAESLGMLRKIGGSS